MNKQAVAHELAMIAKSLVADEPGEANARRYLEQLARLQRAVALFEADISDADHGVRRVSIARRDFRKFADGRLNVAMDKLMDQLNDCLAYWQTDAYA